MTPTAAELTRADTLLIARALAARPATAAELSPLTKLPGWRVRQLLHRAGGASPKPEYRYFVKRHDCYCLTDRGFAEFAADLAPPPTPQQVDVPGVPPSPEPDDTPAPVAAPVEPADFCGERPLPEPTFALPGTVEKLLVMENRRRRKQQLHHPLDAKADADMSGLLASLTNNGGGARVHRSGT
mgnify:CR=1 FL=1